MPQRYEDEVADNNQENKHLNRKFLNYDQRAYYNNRSELAEIYDDIDELKDFTEKVRRLYGIENKYKSPSSRGKRSR